MFDDRQIEEYKSVKAPAGLKTQILEKANAENKALNEKTINMFPRYVAMLAACVLFALIGGKALTYFTTAPMVSIHSNANTPAIAASRDTDMIRSIQLDIETDINVEISVNEGLLYATDATAEVAGKTISGKGKLSFCWEVEASSLDSCEMSITSFLKSYTYTLCETDGVISIITK